MDSMQQIRARMKSISSTRQITTSMRLVSSAKIQRAREQLEANRPFYEQTLQLARRAACGIDVAGHPFVKPSGNKRPCFLVVSGDRGLCGGYHINVCRAAQEQMEGMAQASPRVVALGAKGRDYFRRRMPKHLKESVTGLPEAPLFEDAAVIIALLLGWYRQGEIDSIWLAHTEFVNMLTHTPKVEQLLPLPVEEGLQPPARFEPGQEELLQHAVPFALTAQLYQAILESALCEQSARAVSMDSASKNSDDMIASLTLRYNQARQSAITQEITEIMNGANAVKGK